MKNFDWARRLRMIGHLEGSLELTLGMFVVLLRPYICLRHIYSRCALP
jgi:hypothetical protein